MNQSQNRNRAVLLPHPADPFMFRYWLNLYNKVWASEIDHLYIYISNAHEKPIRDYMIDLCGKHNNLSVMISEEMVDHGIALDRLLEVVAEENVMIIEDDGFIFKSGYVDQCFKAIESGQYDIVGSARGSCAQEILDAAQIRWNLDYSGIGDRGPNFWPCYFWTKKAILLKTDRNFRAKHWLKGDTIPGIDLYVTQDAGLIGDTFVNTSLQLRGMVPQERIKMVPQYHGSPLDLDDYENGRNLWDGHAMWTHVGSLSSGTNGVLIDDDGRPLARRSVDHKKDSDVIPNYCNTEGERKEWERRVQWWITFLDDFTQSDDPGRSPIEVVNFAVEYSKAIYRVIKQYNLSLNAITKRIKIYKRLGL